MGSYIKKHRNIILLILFMVVLYFALLYVFKTFDIDQEKMHTWIGQFGPLSVFVLFGIQFICSITPVPDAVLTAIGMILYGPFLGGLIIFLGMYIAGITHFFIAKKLGKEFITRKFPEVNSLAIKFSNKNTVTKLTYLRMFQVISFDITSYMAGISGATFGQYTLSFVLGLLPHLVSYAFITQGLFADGSTWSIVPGVTIFAVMFVIANWSKIFKKH